MANPVDSGICENIAACDPTTVLELVALARKGLNQE